MEKWTKYFRILSVIFGLFWVITFLLRSFMIGISGFIGSVILLLIAVLITYVFVSKNKIKKRIPSRKSDFYSSLGSLLFVLALSMDAISDLFPRRQLGQHLWSNFFTFLSLLLVVACLIVLFYSGYTSKDSHHED